MNTMVEPGVMCLQAKECQGLLGATRARREAWNRFSLTPSEGTKPADTLLSDFQPPEP